MGYERATKTRRLASHCVICNRLLCDSVSVEIGMGPICRERHFDPLFDNTNQQNQEEVNKLVSIASVQAGGGNVDIVLDIADQIDNLGYPKLALKIRERFVDICIVEENNALSVKTPWSQVFVGLCSRMGLGRFDRKSRRRYISKSRKKELWYVLRKAFPGKQGWSFKGVFTIR